MLIIAFDIFAIGVLVLFLINARINLKNEIINKQFYVKTLLFAENSPSSAKAAEKLNVSVKEFTDFCKKRNIELPEERNERTEAENKKKEEEQIKLLEEEAAWRAEQERITEERRKDQEEETRQRKERLNKFGFR